MIVQTYSYKAAKLITSSKSSSCIQKRKNNYKEHKKKFNKENQFFKCQNLTKILLVPNATTKVKKMQKDKITKQVLKNFAKRRLNNTLKIKTQRITITRSYCSQKPTKL
jgi:hypothetical protein